MKNHFKQNQEKKNAELKFRTRESVKNIFIKRAEESGRSYTNYFEWLMESDLIVIDNHSKKLLEDLGLDFLIKSIKDKIKNEK